MLPRLAAAQKARSSASSGPRTRTRPAAWTGDRGAGAPASCSTTRRFTRVPMTGGTML